MNSREKVYTGTVMLSFTGLQDLKILQWSLSSKSNDFLLLLLPAHWIWEEESECIRVWEGHHRDFCKVKKNYCRQAKKEKLVVTVWKFVFPPNSYVEILTPKVKVLGGGAFGRWLGHEGGALMNEISAFIKRDPRVPSALLPCEVTVSKWHLWTRNQVLTRHRARQLLGLGFPASRAEINKSLLFISQPVSVVLVFFFP